MNIVFLFSVILKGIGAVLEVLLQILITRGLGVAGYGNYSTWINVADLIFWVLFSGLVKCNTFYLSGRNSSIRKFKRRYYLWYVIPALIVIAAAAVIFSGEALYGIVLLITGLELAVMDQSSTMIARGKAVTSLIGEYILGRVIIVLGVVGLLALDWISLPALLVLYVIQYVCVILFYFLKRPGKNQDRADISDTVSVKKWGAYQRADILQAMNSQMPVIVQYFFSGAFEAGVVSIVMLVKKLINFISGPSAKVFLPEFSRLYHAGKREEIRTSFSSIMRMQMLFVGPVAVALIGFPDVVLRILAEELLEYANLFVVCSMVFLVAATLGPCAGVMQMTGNEKKDNQYREAALVGMLLVMILFSKDRLFVLYGLCVQTGMESIGKYIFVCRWMGKAPVRFKQYIGWWIMPAAAIAAARILHLQSSLAAMVCFAGCVFLFKLISELRSDASLLRGLFGRGRD